ncbi:antitoxin family protein [Thermococcus sp. MAR1]|uniref:antitoxin family protein n=1 Tax=Thermococcus sp. MAR1 TaxID=1638263 RepID=UPI00143BA990|nr:antitoxin family protein [Thermococcus sp. MAR1]NJE11177.1 DUF104 domain-containing protein [Thermococcus sp. MAR1]
MSKVIVAVYRGDIIIPLEKLNIPSGAKLRIRIEAIEKGDSLKDLGYLKLLQKGEDAEELFEI